MQNTNVLALLHFRKFECALRSYEGDDPLSVWYDYINWTEQNFPSGGKTGQLMQLLTSCIKQFTQTKQYNDDERFVEIWITFVSITICTAAVHVLGHLLQSILSFTTTASIPANAHSIAAGPQVCISHLTSTWSLMFYQHLCLESIA